jgi:hypothetical protein
MAGLGSLRGEKQRGHFFHKENKDSDNAQNDGDPAHRNDGLSKAIKDATPRHTG